MKKLKRVLAAHDISCFGKCSLTVALPIISACGVETTILPTAVLSTHTGGFTGFTYRDLTEDITPIIDHFKTLPIEFDGVYTGFLGSFEQIEIMKDTFERVKSENTLILVDPVMADHGELYSIFDNKFPLKMRELCQTADIVIPNITEALFMLEREFVKGPYTKEFIEELLESLKSIGFKKIVLTGVYFDNEQLGAAAFDTETNVIDYLMSEKIDGFYHGTGDVFGSALLGALMNDFTLSESTQIAVNFVCECIRKTQKAGTDVRFGVNFEQSLDVLLNAIKKNI